MANGLSRLLRKHFLLSNYSGQFGRSFAANASIKSTASDIEVSKGIHCLLFSTSRSASQSVLSSTEVIEPKSLCSKYSNTARESEGEDSSKEEKMSSDDLILVDFEVFGRVQGVFFRKYTEMKANELGLGGWCRNHRSGTVVGTLEGTRTKVGRMKEWLSKTGSPHSHIAKAEFKNEKLIDNLNYTGFKIKA